MHPREPDQLFSLVVRVPSLLHLDKKYTIGKLYERAFFSDHNQVNRGRYEGVIDMNVIEMV